MLSRLFVAFCVLLGALTTTQAAYEPSSLLLGYAPPFPIPSGVTWLTPATNTTALFNGSEPTNTIYALNPGTYNVGCPVSGSCTSSGTPAGEYNGAWKFPAGSDNIIVTCPYGGCIIDGGQGSTTGTNIYPLVDSGPTANGGDGSANVAFINLTIQNFAGTKGTTGPGANGCGATGENWCAQAYFGAYWYVYGGIIQDSGGLGFSAGGGPQVFQDILVKKNAHSGMGTQPTNTVGGANGAGIYIVGCEFTGNNTRGDDVNYDVANVGKVAGSNPYTPGQPIYFLHNYVHDPATAGTDAFWNDTQGTYTYYWSNTIGSGPGDVNTGEGVRVEGSLNVSIEHNVLNYNNASSVGVDVISYSMHNVVRENAFVINGANQIGLRWYPDAGRANVFGVWPVGAVDDGNEFYLAAKYAGTSGGVNQVVWGNQAITMTASISGNTLAVTAITGGTLLPGDIIWGGGGGGSGNACGNGYVPCPYIVAYQSGASGGHGNYTLGVPGGGYYSETVASGAIYTQGPMYSANGVVSPVNVGNKEGNIYILAYSGAATTDGFLGYAPGNFTLPLVGSTSAQGYGVETASQVTTTGAVAPIGCRQTGCEHITPIGAWTF